MYRSSVVALTIVTCTLFTSLVSAQHQGPLTVRPAIRIHAIDDRRTVTLPGNRHPLARPAYEVGLADPASRMERMILVLQPDALQQKAIDDLTAAQHDPPPRHTISGSPRKALANTSALLPRTWIA